MRLDPSRFHQVNITDTCAVWNLLSSTTLYRAAVSAKCVFSITHCVMYECLRKPRTEVREEDEELQRRLQREMMAGAFQQHPVSLESLQDPRVLGLRANLGKGEVSVIAFALETGQAIITDDRGARRQAERHMDIDRVQTTPKLLGWLFYTNCLGDADKDVIIAEHEALQPRVPLSGYFGEVYLWALQCRLSAASGSTPDTGRDGRV